MNLFKYWLLIFSFLLITVACKSPKKERVELMSERNSIHLQGVLIRLLDYPLTNLICPTDSNFFIFLKTTDEYRDSWVYLVTVKDSFVKVEYRLLPSFKKTGYDHYYADTMQFVYYESYQLNIERQLWDEFTQNNVFQNLMNNHTDTIYEMDMGFSMPNYLFWYNESLHVCNSYLKNYHLFEKLDHLINEQIYPIIEHRKNNPLGRFEK